MGVERLITLENVIKHTTTRKELYDEVWDISAAATARKYDVPYQQFLAQLKEADIPTPPSGYWAKLSSGKEVTVLELTGEFNKKIEFYEKIKNISYAQKKIDIETTEKLEKEAIKKLEEVANFPDSIEMGNTKYNYYDREGLYKEVWSDPVTEVAKKYHVSDNAIRKVCKSLNVPTPPAGYWAKVITGSKIKRPPLPKGNYPKGKHGLRNSKWIEPEKQLDIKEKLSFLDEETLAAILSIADQISLSDENQKFSSTVLKQKKRIIKWQKEYQKNLAKGWGKHNLEDPPMNADNLSEEGVQRRSRILDSIIRAIEPYGCQLLPNKEAFIINDEIVSFTFSEAKDKIPHVLTKKENMEMLKYQEDKKRGGYAYEPRVRKYDYPFNGKLSLRLCNNRTFRDSKSYQLEERLGEVLVALYEASESVRVERLAREEAERKREEERILKKKKIDRYNEEVEQTLFLLNEAVDFEKAERIRKYVEAATKSENRIKYSDEWIEWAKKKADWFDPTVAVSDEFFGEREHFKNEEAKIIKEKSSFWY